MTRVIKYFCSSVIVSCFKKSFKRYSIVKVFSRVNKRGLNRGQRSVRRVMNNWPRIVFVSPRIVLICRIRLLASSRPSERLGWHPANGDGRAFPCAAGRSTQFRGHGDGLLSASIRLHGELHAGGEAVHPSFLETTDARVRWKPSSAGI